MQLKLHFDPPTVRGRSTLKNHIDLYSSIILSKKMSDKIIKNSRTTAYITALFMFKGQLTFAFYACGL